MFDIELDETMLRKVTTSVKVLDALYSSELDFEESIDVLKSLANSFSFGRLVGMDLNKESIKVLRNSMQRDIDAFNKKKADETITDFLK